MGAFSSIADYFTVIIRGVVAQRDGLPAALLPEKVEQAYHFFSAVRVRKIVIVACEHLRGLFFSQTGGELFSADYADGIGLVEKGLENSVDQLTLAGGFAALCTDGDNPARSHGKEEKEVHGA